MAIDLKRKQEITALHEKFSSFFSLHQSHLRVYFYGTLLLPLMLLTTTVQKDNTIRGYSRLFAWNCELYWFKVETNLRVEHTYAKNSAHPRTL